MSRHFLLLTIAAAVLALCACASTTFTSTWKAPDVRSLNPVGKTIAVVLVSRDENERRAGEDALAADLTARHAHGVAAYTLLPNEGREDGEAARVRLKQAGVNGVVVMRVLGKDQHITHTQDYAGPDRGGFAMYWDNSWGTVYEPGYQSDSLVSVETLVYSLDRDKLVWASASHTTNPRDLDSMIREVAEATAREMAMQGPVPFSPPASHDSDHFY